MKQFKYRILKYDAKGFLGGKIDLDLIEQEFNKLGDHGWELVSFMDTNESYGNTKWVIATFKKAIDTAP